MKNTHPILWAVFAAALTVLAPGCVREDNPGDYRPEHTLIYCGMGYNNKLAGSISDDIREMLEGSFIPTIRSRRGLVVVSHLQSGAAEGGIPVNIVRVYRNSRGKTVSDTLGAIPGVNALTDSAALSEALRCAINAVPSDSYGLIFSSHGTGWLPKGYYEAHGENVLGASGADGTIPYDLNPLPGPAVKSFGNEIPVIDGKQTSIQLDLREVVGAIPVHADYIILDMCLMGGVEVAYQFRDLTDMLVSSPTEILSDGLSYTNMVRNLLYGAEPDLRAVCSEYCDHYRQKQSFATVSLTDCSKLDTLASVCGDLFRTYGVGIATVKQNRIQRYFRYGKHWFYDREDILAKAGISPTDSARLSKALLEAVPFRDATEQFLPGDGGFDISAFCGLSMYLPKMGDAELDSFYATLDWNKATGLVNLEK